LSSIYHKKVTLSSILSLPAVKLTKYSFFDTPTGGWLASYAVTIQLTSAEAELGKMRSHQRLSYCNNYGWLICVVFAGIFFLYTYYFTGACSEFGTALPQLVPTVDQET
jgi:biotin transporter BioY